MNIPDDFFWHTEQPHWDNHETLVDFLDNHLPYDWLVNHTCAGYGEIEHPIEGKWEVCASGAGDSYQHMVTFLKLNQIN